MAEGMFSIFPDTRRVPGSAAKDDGLLSSQKKALRDVKNTLRPHSNFGKPTLKHGLDSSNVVPVNQDRGSIYSDPIDQFWDPCDCSPTDDDFLPPRSHNEYLHNVDFSYVMRGLSGIPTSDYGNDSDCSDVDCSYLDEPFFPETYDFMDIVPLPTEMYLPPLDLDPLRIIDVEDE